MDQLSGTVERVTFHTEDTGYSVLKVKVKGRHEPVTVTGKVPLIHEGEVIKAEGEWVNVAEYGRQFKAEQIETTAPREMWPWFTRDPRRKASAYGFSNQRIA